MHGVILKENYDFITQINKQTTGYLAETWVKNLQDNIHLWKKCGSIKDCLGIGKNKATIGVGAGPSFNKNKELFARVVNVDGVNDWEYRDFITIASNHQFKPLLKMGVIPDFVLLVDAGTKGVYEQLCEDIPSEAGPVTLITGLQCSPRIVNAWLDQGRPIKFFLSPSPDLMEEFNKITGKNPRLHKLELGGNVLNGAWMISLAVFQSTVFMGLGNDLSYPLIGDLDERRKAYYSDGDYTTNAQESGSGRDEAKVGKIWGGFTLKRKSLVIPGQNDRYDITIDTVGTSHTLWVYKTWLESTVMGQSKTPVSFHYFNCTEGGILGVLAKDQNTKAMNLADNWFMLDSVCPKYHTAMFEDAVTIFLKAKEMMEKDEWQNTDRLLSPAARAATATEVLN